MSDIVEFDAHKVKNYIDRTIDGFLNDPPDTAYQKGFLAAIIVISQEALNRKDDRVTALERYL